MSRLLWFAAGCALAWWLAERYREVRATVSVLEDEITIKPSAPRGSEAFDPDAPLPLGGLR